MNRAIAVGLGMFASAALGAVAFQSLHAQAKPPVYLVAVIDVANPEAYGKEFAVPAQANIRNAGGKFVAIGGAGAGPVTAFDGEAPKRVVIITWDSLEKIKVWYNSAEYQNILKTGQKYAKINSFAVEGQSP